VTPSSVSFLSYNSTGLSDVKCDWLNSLCETTESTYISVQEHFRKSRSIDKYFKDQFPKFHSYVTPGYREEGQSRGRPKAGLAQLSLASVGVRKDRVMYSSNRIQAQVLNLQSSRLLWLNVYFPTDPGTAVYNGDELHKVLNDVEKIIEATQFDDVLIAGDMNWHMSRQSGFALAIQQFLSRLNLHSLWERHNIDFTHMHTNNISVSTIDHFVMNERLLDLVTDCGPLHLGDNQSRHSPIMVKLDLGALPARRKVEVARPRRPAWYKATEQQQEDYRADLERRLQSVPVPACLECEDLHCLDAGHSEARDGFVLNMTGALIESCQATIPMVGGRQGAVRADSGCVPGWREEVAPFREASIFWHSVWLSAGRPAAGQLYMTMKMTRNKYHHALRRVKLAADRIKAQKLFEASMWGGGDLLSELKKTRGGRFSPDLPENVAGANGEEEICETFKGVYNELYNSAPPRPR
jgi:exonuclease III